MNKLKLKKITFKNINCDLWSDKLYFGKPFRGWYCDETIHSIYYTVCYGDTFLGKVKEDECEKLCRKHLKKLINKHIKEINSMIEPENNKI